MTARPELGPDPIVVRYLAKWLAKDKTAPSDSQKARWLRLVREINAARAVIDRLPKGPERTRWKQNEREAVRTLLIEMKWPGIEEFTFHDGTRIEVYCKPMKTLGPLPFNQFAYPRLNIFLK